jgi:hypothetical protein
MFVRCSEFDGTSRSAPLISCQLDRFSIFTIFFAEFWSANIAVAFVVVITPHVIEFVRSIGLVRAIFYCVGEEPQQGRCPCNQAQF